MATIIVTILDPCEAAILLLDQNPFPLLTIYPLGDPEIALPWTESNLLITDDANLDCGDPVFQFFNFDGTPYDMTLFEDARNPNAFTIKLQNDPSVVDLYPLKYTAWFSDAPSNTVDSTEFNV